MLFAQLPSLPGRPPLARYPWGEETIVVHDRIRSAVYGRHTAPLSLKAVLHGAEKYNVHGFFETVEASHCLVVNDRQEYESAIESDSEVETLCVFFSAEDVREASRATCPTDKLLADREALGDPMEFAAVKRPLTGALATLLSALPHLRTAPRLEQQSITLGLLGEMAALEAPHAGHARRLDALRASTRAELYRRCAVGRAFIEASYAEDISLEQVARIADLSKDHFLRAFKACFGETPYQALRRIRLFSAANLLAHGSRNVSEVALAVGYGNFSAFARAFRQVHGVTPSSIPRKSAISAQHRPPDPAITDAQAEHADRGQG